MKLSIEASFDEIVCICNRIGEATFREMLVSDITPESENNTTESGVIESEEQPIVTETEEKSEPEIELHIESTPENTQKAPIKKDIRDSVMELAIKVSKEKGPVVLKSILQKLECEKVTKIPEDKLETAITLLEQEL